MKKLLLIVFLIIVFPLVCLADSTVQFTWNPNSESDLAGYNLYQTDTSGNYVIGVDIPADSIPVGTETSTITVKDGTWFWVLTAFDIAGNESGPSNEVTATLDSIAPGEPVLNVTVTVTIIR